MRSLVYLPRKTVGNDKFSNLNLVTDKVNERRSSTSAPAPFELDYEFLQSAREQDSTLVHFDHLWRPATHLSLTNREKLNRAPPKSLVSKSPRHGKLAAASRHAWRPYIC